VNRSLIGIDLPPPLALETGQGLSQRLDDGTRLEVIPGAPPQQDVGAAVEPHERAHSPISRIIGVNGFAVRLVKLGARCQGVVGQGFQRDFLCS